MVSVLKEKYNMQTENKRPKPNTAKHWAQLQVTYS